MESDSGTDDDLPASFYQYQQPKAQDARAGRQSEDQILGGGTRFDNLPVMEDKDTSILELEAYTAVLHAFGSQSTALTWSKERLMCDLRKELRISEEQHRHLTEELEARQVRSLVKVSEADPVPDMQLPSSSSAIPKLRITLKTPNASQPSQVVAPLQMLVSQPSLESTVSQSANRGKSCPPLLMGTSSSRIPVRSSVLSSNPNLQRTPGGNSTSGSDLHCDVQGSNIGKDPHLQFRREFPPQSNKLKGPQKQSGPYLGQKVQRFGPGDSGLIYDALIVDYDEETGKHALGYDIGTPKESIEWVNFKDIARGEIRLVEGPPVCREFAVPRGRGRGSRRRGCSARGRTNLLARTSGPVSGLAIARDHSTLGGNACSVHISRNEHAANMKGRGMNVKAGNEIQSPVPEKNVRISEVITVKVPVIADLFAEAENLDEIVDPEKLTNMEQKVNKIAEALRTALHDLGESSNEDDGYQDGRNSEGDAKEEN